ncbi:MAG: hypothetical protein Q9162_005256 [Coniocarpon cinnabarinum]
MAAVLMKCRYLQMQATQEGLLRSLLWRIFCSTPSTISKAVPDRWKDSLAHRLRAPWSFTELKSTLQRIVLGDATDTNFCFFIDGLDEYTKDRADASIADERDWTDIACTLNDLALHDHVKICVASRCKAPINTLLRRDPCFHTLEMQEHSSRDIAQFTRTELEKLGALQEQIGSEEDREELIQTFTEKADGIWLWAKHALKCLHRGLGYGEDVRSILCRAEKIPQSLDELYMQDLEDIDEEHKPQAAKILLMSLYINEPLPVITLHLAGLLRLDKRCLAEQYQPDCFKPLPSHLEALLALPDPSVEARSTELRDWSESAVNNFIQKPTVQGPISARCQDFLRLGYDHVLRESQDEQDADKLPIAIATHHRLVSPHRTYRDFLLAHEHTLRDYAQGFSNVHELLLRSYSDHLISLARLYGSEQVALSISSKKESFRVLLTGMLHSLTQLMGSEEARPPNLEEDPDDDHISKMHRFSHSTANRIRASAGISGLLSPIWKNTQNASYGYFFSELQRFLLDENHAGFFINRKAMEMSQYRHQLEARCSEVDSTGSLWTLLHVIPILLLLEADVNQMRGQASIWNCWLQVLMKLDGAAASEETMDKSLRKMLGSLTILLLDSNADREFTLRWRLQKLQACDIIAKAFGPLKGKKYLNGGTAAWTRYCRPNELAYLSFLRRLANGVK